MGRNEGGLSARPTRWALALLLLALSTTLLFSNERGQFYRVGNHNNLSTHHMSIAVNLSPAHDFLLFERRVPVSEDDVRYIPYNSRPPGGHILIKLATLPFDGLSAQIYAAQVLMLLFSAAAALLVFDAARRLTANPWLALSVTLFAFASPYWLYYNDQIATETLALFGVALAFHGMTIFALEGRFGQLVAKVFAAVLLGWFVFALLLPFIVLGVMRDALGEPGRWRDRWRRLVRGHYFRLGVISGLFGLGMVAFCMANEQRAHLGERPFSSLQMFAAMVDRFGLSEDFNTEHAEMVGVPAAIERSLYRIGRAAAPFALPGYAQNLGDWPIRGEAPKEGPAARVLGFVVVAGAWMGLLFVRRRVLLAAAALCGLVWGIGLRHMSAFHDFESRLFLGLCALFFALALCWLRRVAGDRLMPAVALFAVACFVQSSWSMGEVGADAQTSERGQRLLADFELIRKVVRGSTVSVEQGVILDQEMKPMLSALNHYLHGSEVMLKPDERLDLADFTVMAADLDIPGALTPGNAEAFLYDTGQLTTFVQGLVDGGRQVVEHADFNVHVHEGERVLIFVADAVPAEAMHILFHVEPANLAALPAAFRHVGFHWLNFTFTPFIQLEGRQWAQVVSLPNYPKAWIAIGRMRGNIQLWRQGFGLDSG